MKENCYFTSPVCWHPTSGLSPHGCKRAGEGLLKSIQSRREGRGQKQSFCHVAFSFMTGEKPVPEVLYHTCLSILPSSWQTTVNKVLPWPPCQDFTSALPQIPLLRIALSWLQKNHLGNLLTIKVIGPHPLTFPCRSKVGLKNMFFVLKISNARRLGSLWVA